MTEKNTKTNRITSRQIVAWIGIVLLLLMYIVTLIVAITDSSASGNLFFMCLIMTVAIPFFIWIYTWMYGKLTGKHTIADLEPEGQKIESDTDQTPN